MNTTRSYGVLDRRHVASRLPDGWVLESVAQTGSTNTDLLSRWANDPAQPHPDATPIKPWLRALTAPIDWARSCAAFPPIVRVADEQTAGRGRQGRPWRTVPGEGLLFSIGIVMPCSVDALAGLSLAVGLGIVEGLRALPAMTPARARRLGLKWPNDILLDEAKLGGVLIEVAGTGAHACAVVIGIGLNLRGTPAAASDAGSPPGLPPACLAMLMRQGDSAEDSVSRSPDDSHEHRPDTWRGDVLCAITHALVTRLSTFSTSGFEAMREAWWRVHRFAGRPIRILDGGVEKVSGIAAGVDARGQLLVDTGIGGTCSAEESGYPMDARADDHPGADAVTTGKWVAVQAGDVSLRLAEHAPVRHRLLIDSGNSRLKWALTDAAGAWLAHGAANKSNAHDAGTAAPAPSLDNVATSDAVAALRSPTALEADATEQLQQAWRTLTPPDEIWISNVAGATIAASIAAACSAMWPNTPRHVIRAQPAQCGVVNTYAQPETLGSDRWAGMIAAHAAYPGEALLIATFGTATTIDTISADGRFNGGWIAPGWSVMLRSLGQHAAQLPTLHDADVHAGMAAGFARTTREAIVEGCRQAQAGLIMSAWRTWEDDATDASATRRCIVAGGAAREVLPVLSMPITRHDDLVLQGLSHIARAPASPEEKR
ncbi:biotin--[acetyl-CoA-carboxylase] ligase [Robbsia andropogonis]|uniref:biotin--[acetyl-CoA-carboxylase] ligase n=1 Tax=Robbsia andropogonis TaxID=28092 RepID=UPI002A6B0DF0|nr:biotin--[acetyl-CoA-carboxylase] ligase [Robbsia andropogonis]